MSERGIGWLFVLLLAVQLAVLAKTAPEERTRGSLVSALGLRIVGPMARWTSDSAATVATLGARLRQRRELYDENRRLKTELERLQLEITRLRAAEQEAGSLATALGYARAADERLTVARVVYLDAVSTAPTLLLYVGGRAQLDQPVLSQHGLVGRIVQVVGSYARAQVLLDPAVGVGAMIERNRRQGVVRMDGRRNLLLDYLPRSVSVEVGDRVVTAGIDALYPPGILIGTVAEVSPGEELSPFVRLAPAVDFSTLDHVYLLDRQQVPKELLPTAVPPRADR